MILQMIMNDGKLKVNTNNGNIKFNGEIVGNYIKGRKVKDGLADLFEEMLGAKEWDSEVEKIQRWYYNSYVKAPWCATALSYFANKSGVDSKIGKHENCDRLKEFMEKLGLVYKTKRYDSKSTYKPKRNDVVFMSNKYTYDDITHVGVVTSVNTESGEVTIISGNTSKDDIGYNTYNYITGTYIIAFGKV